MQTYPDIFESVTFSFRIQIFHVHSYLYSNQICPSTRIQHVSRYTVVRRTPLRTATATKTSRKKWIRTSSNFYLTYSDSFIVKCWQIFLELNFKRLYQSSGKEREGRCIVFTCLTQREIRHFHVVVVQRRQRNLQKRVMHVQSCCLNSYFFELLSHVFRPVHRQMLANFFEVEF